MSEFLGMAVKMFKTPLKEYRLREIRFVALRDEDRAVDYRRAIHTRGKQLVYPPPCVSRIVVESPLVVVLRLGVDRAGRHVVREYPEVA